MLETLSSSFISNPEKITFTGEDFDENVLFLLRRNFITNAPWVFFTFVLIFLPFLMRAVFDAVGGNTAPTFLSPAFQIILVLFLYLFAFGYFFVNFINWFFNAYLITNKRVVDMDVHGLLYRDVAEAPLRNIEDITHKVFGIFPTMFNFGDIHIQTAAETKEIDFISVTDPIRVQDILSDLVSEVQHKHE